MKPLRELFRRKSADAMACQTAVELLSLYLDDALSQQDRTRLEAHLAGCGHCSEYLAQIQASIRLTGQTEPGDLDENSRTALTDLFRTWQDPS